MSFVLGALFCLPGVIWLVIESRWGPSTASVADPAVERWKRKFSKTESGR